MCDRPEHAGGPAWHGWQDFPPQRQPRAFGPWVDLTHPFGPGVPRVSLFGPPTVEQIATMPEQPMNVTRIATIVHIGTHIDAPRHFVADGPSMEAIPLERHIAQGVVVRIDKPACGLIEPADLERTAPPIEPGDIVAIDTGWARHWGTPEWSRQPSLTEAAAWWLVERRVRLLAVDTATPELSPKRRGPDYGFPIHRTLLSHGVLIAEQVANLGALAGRRVELMFAPLPIVGSDGAPARVLGRTIEL